MATKRKPIVKARKPVQKRSRETVRAILQGAERVLADGGRAAFTTNRVALVAGVSKGTLYEYFRSTEELLRAVEEFSWTKMIEEITSLMQGPPPATAEEGISRIVHGAMKAIAHRASMHGLTLDVAGNHGARRRLLNAFAGAAVGRLEARVPRERLRPSDLQLAARIITAVVAFMAWLELHEVAGKADPAAFREMVVTLVQSFLLRDAPASSASPESVPTSARGR